MSVFADKREIAEDSFAMAYSSSGTKVADLIAYSGGKFKDAHITIRMYSMAVKEQLRQLLMSSEGTIPIDVAIKMAEKKWPKSK